jgi:hypothetical protein
MRCVLIAVVLLPTAIWGGADDLPKVTGILGGKKVKFPDKELATAAKATVALLESCHSLDDGSNCYTIEDLEKARKGNHVRLMFAKPITVAVLGDSFRVTELVFTQPSNIGVFWLRSGDKVRRATKYEFEKQKPVDAWLSQAQAAD